MSLSRSEIIAELNRRGVSVPEEPQESLPREVIEAELRRRGAKIPTEQGWGGVGEDIWQGVKNVPGSLYNIATELPGELYGAGEQVLTDPMRALQNFGQGAINFGEGLNNLYPNVRDYLREKGITKQTSPDILQSKPHIDIGELTGRGKQKPGDALLAALTEYALPLKGAKLGTAGAGGLRNIAQTAGVMGAHAAGQGENPVTAALTLGGLKGAGRAVGSAVRGASNLRSGNIANRILEDRANLRNEFTNEYRNIFNEAEQSGAGRIEVPRINEPRILRNMTHQDAQTFRNFLQNPTIENAHWARSDLGKKISALEKKGPSLSNTKLRDLREMQRAQERISREMQRTFSRSDNPGLGQRYSDVTQRYGSEMMPYETKVIRDFARPKFGRERGMTPGKFIKKLAKNEDFNLTLAERYPEVSRNIFARKLGKGSLIAGAASAIGFPGYYIGKHVFNNIFE